MVFDIIINLVQANFKKEIFMKVHLLAHTPEPEKLVASAAKLCYSPSSINETQSKLTPENIKTFVKMLANIGHESPLEHISFTFGIEGVSRALLAQLTRHRIASYSVQSQRYVNNFNFKYVIPPEIENIPTAKEEFLIAMQEAQNHYDSLSLQLQNKHLKNLMDLGMDKDSATKAAEKMAIEDARYVLPNACVTNIICTFNARSLLNFFSHRCCNRAQWEIRNLAVEMLKSVKKECPNIFAYAGPPCVHNHCTEGKMSCGKSAEVKEIFKNL